MQPNSFIQMVPFLAVLTVVKEVAIIMLYVTASVAAVSLSRWLNRHS